VRAPVEREQQRPPEGELVEEAAAELVAVLQAVLQEVADPGVLLLLVVPVGLVVRVVRQQDLLDQMDHPLNPMDLVGVRVLVLASWGDPAWAGFLGRTSVLPSVDIVGGATVTVDWVLLVETVLGIGWKILLCRTERSGM